jgi:hypothetical protein
MRDLPPWVDWTDRERMAMVAIHRWWALFDEGGKPVVVKRRRVTDKTGPEVRELLDLEQYDLDGDALPPEAAAFLRQQWAEHRAWADANRRK